MAPDEQTGAAMTSRHAPAPAGGAAMTSRHAPAPTGSAAMTSRHAPGPTRGATHSALPGGLPQERDAPEPVSALALTQATPYATPRVRRVWTRRIRGELRARCEPAALRWIARARGESAAFRSAASAEWRSPRCPHSRAPTWHRLSVLVPILPGVPALTSVRAAMQAPMPTHGPMRARSLTLLSMRTRSAAPMRSLTLLPMRPQALASMSMQAQAWAAMPKRAWGCRATARRDRESTTARGKPFCWLPAPQRTRKPACRSEKIRAHR